MTSVLELDCEAGEFSGVVLGLINGMHHVRIGKKEYYYEPGDSYLYDSPDGGRSHYLGEVYNATIRIK